jgi:lipopolysaccharide export system permease protein
MRTLDRYILRAVSAGTLLAMAFLLPLVAFLLLSDELDHVGTGRYALADAFAFIGLSMPRYAYQLFPIAVLIGTLLGLGGLAANLELTAMRAAGISVARIVGAALKAGLAAAALAVLLGEVIAPYSEARATQLRAEGLSDTTALKSKHGFWARDGNAFVNIREILPGGHLRNVAIHELDGDRRLKLTTHAREAVYTGDAWRLTRIRQSEISDEGVTTRYWREAVWDSLLDPGMLSLLVVDPHALPVWGLHRYIGFMEENGLSATNYKAAFWSKIAAPLVILAMIFLSVPLLFGTLRSGGVGQRIFVGVLIGVAFYVLDRAFSQISLVYAVPPVLAAFVPGLLCFVAGIWFYRRVR